MSRKYGKLRERIQRYFVNNNDFAEAMNLNPATLSKKLNGKALFTSGEIEEACYLLEIPIKEIPDYFFYS